MNEPSTATPGGWLNPDGSVTSPIPSETASSDHRLTADALAARPAVDVEGIARMIFAHEESTSVGDEMHCNGCGEVIDGGDLNLDQARHQAAAVVAFLAGESRDR